MANQHRNALLASATLSRQIAPLDELVVELGATAWASVSIDLGQLPAMPHPPRQVLHTLHALPAAVSAIVPTKCTPQDHGLGTSAAATLNARERLPVTMVQYKAPHQ